MRPRGDASGTRAGVMLRRSSTKGTATLLVRRCRRMPTSVPCRSRSLTKPSEQSELASAHRWLTLASLGSHWACVEMPLEGLPDCCSGARARREPRRHWYGGVVGLPGACHAGTTASPSHVSSRSERHHTAGSHRPRTAEVERGDASETRAGVLLRRSSTKETARPLVRRSQGAPRSVPWRSHTLTKPRVQSE